MMVPEHRSIIFSRAALGSLCLLYLGCGEHVAGGDVPAALSLPTGTYLATYGEDLDEGACGQIGTFGVSMSEFAISPLPSNDGEFEVRDVFGGCELTARLNGSSTLIAHGESCRLDEDGGLARSGVTARTYRHFELDFERGLFRAAATTTDYRSTYGVYTSCLLLETFAEAPKDVGRRLRYQGVSNGDIENDDPACGRVASIYHPVGYVQVFVAEDGETAAVHEEASGCRLELTKSEDGAFNARAGTSCAFEGEVVLSKIGYEERAFDQYRLDLAAMKLNYQVRHRRLSYDGTLQYECATVELDLSE